MANGSGMGYMGMELLVKGILHILSYLASKYMEGCMKYWVIQGGKDCWSLNAGWVGDSCKWRQATLALMTGGGVDRQDFEP